MVVFLTSCLHFFSFLGGFFTILLGKSFCLEGFCVLSISLNSSENICVGVLSFSAVAEYRSSPPEVFLRKVVLNICSKSTGEHSWEIVISIKLLCNFIEFALRHGCSPVNLLHVFKTPFSQSASEQLPLRIETFL